MEIGTKTRLVQLLLLCAISMATGFAGTLCAQPNSSKGTEFWVGFMDNLNSSDPSPPITLYLYISSDIATSGTVDIPAIGYSDPFSVAAGSVVTVALPVNDALVSTSETVVPKGVLVRSDDPVTVYARNHKNTSSDATIVLPTETLGSTYRAMGYSVFDASNPSQLLIVGTTDNSSIRITPASTTTSGSPAGAAFDINLNRGEVFQLKSVGDLTGTLIENSPTASNCNRFAVFSGNRCAYVPVTCGFCDHLFQQMPPIAAWGQSFVSTPLATRNGDEFRILASEDNTFINVDGITSLTLNAGEFSDVFLIAPTKIDADAPIAVAQFSRGGVCDGMLDSDPFMILINPVEQSIKDITFTSFNSSLITGYFLNMLVRTEDESNVLFDGSPLPPSTFFPVSGSTEFKFGQMVISPGTHRLEAPMGLSAYVYGYGEFESYGYTAGSNFFTLQNTFYIVYQGDTTLYYEFDKTISCNDAVSFVAESPVGNFWSFGDGNSAAGQTSAHIYESGGTFELEYILNDSLNCPDTIKWPLEIAPPAHNIPLDTAFCTGSAVVLEMDPTFEVTWPDGSKNQTFETDTPGTFFFTVGDGLCTNLDSVSVTENPLPSPNWPARPIVCPELQSAVILSPGPGLTASWTDFGNANPLLVDQAGEYEAILENASGCTISSVVEVQEDCGIVLTAPNAFTPDGDGLNDLFLIQGDNLAQFELHVYNRWGELVFQTENIQTGWDGSYRGVALGTDTYIWRAVYRDVILPDKEKIQKGAVHLLR